MGMVNTANLRRFYSGSAYESHLKLLRGKSCIFSQSIITFSAELWCSFE